MSVHKLNEKQCTSRSDGFFRSHLIWIYTVFKGNVYPGSAVQGLNLQEFEVCWEIHVRSLKLSCPVRKGFEDLFMCFWSKLLIKFIYNVETVSLHVTSPCSEHPLILHFMLGGKKGIQGYFIIFNSPEPEAPGELIV